MLKKFTDTSPSDGTAANSANIVTGLDAFESMQIVTVFQGATGDTLDICLQYCDDPDGSTWFDYARWQIAAAAAPSARSRAAVASWLAVLTSSAARLVFALAAESSSSRASSAIASAGLPP